MNQLAKNLNHLLISIFGLYDYMFIFYLLIFSEEHMYFFQLFKSFLNKIKCPVMLTSVICSWQRETRVRNFGGRLQGEVAYYAPCGKKLRQYPEVIKVNIFLHVLYIWF